MKEDIESGKEPTVFFAWYASLTWLLFAIFFLLAGRQGSALINFVGAIFTFLIGFQARYKMISSRFATQLALGGCLMALFVEAVHHGQSQTEAVWFMVTISLASGFLLGQKDIAVWAALTCLAQVLVQFAVPAPPVGAPVQKVDGWEITFGQVMLSVLCAGFAFMSRRTADERLRLVLQRERYIKDQSKQLEEARDAAVAATVAKSRFLSTMSHEIRTPLYGILGAAQAIEAERLENKDYENVTTIVQSGELLLAVLNDILDSAKLDAGELSLHHRAFNLKENLEAACRLVRPLTERKGLSLSLELAPDLPTHWLGDDFRIRQILLNLLNNACKFSAGGTVTLRAAGVTGALELSVRDEGIGISPEDQGRLFQPFQQIVEGDARLHDGTGLGLWIVRRLASLMKGEVKLDSAPGEGSVFTVTLPLIATVTAASNAQSQVVPAPQPAEEPRQPPLSVLVVDDNALNRKVTLNLLKRLGHNAIAVEGGAEALLAIEGSAYDAVLMDLQMPEMDGIAATKAIRAVSSIRQPFIIAFSADVQAGKKLEFGPQAFNTFLGKPLRLEQLSDCLKAARPL